MPTKTMTASLRERNCWRWLRAVDAEAPVVLIAARVLIHVAAEIQANS